MTNIIHKISKVLILLIIMQIIFALTNISQAAWWDDITSIGINFLEIGENAASSGEQTDSELQTIISDIYNILFPLGIAITVIIGGVLGIKFMMASAEDKAKIKESMIPYVLGCVVIYGAFGIWKLAITIFSALG